MGRNSTQREILLLTGTSFSSRQWSEKDESEKKAMSDVERLQDACWYGLVKDILPELFREDSEINKIYLWQILEGKSFLELDMGETPFKKDGFYSIDPYSFLSEQSYS
jgi:hypothetical protein